MDKIFITYNEEVSIKDYVNIQESFDTIKIKLDENCIRKMKRYYLGWECDNVIWIMKDTIIGTNHGTYYIIPLEEWDEYVNEMTNHVKELESINLVDNDTLCLIKEQK